MIEVTQKDLSVKNPEIDSNIVTDVTEYTETDAGTEVTEVIDGEAPADPFDPETLRLSQDFGENFGVKKLTTTVPVRKPTKESFVRTHADESYRLETRILELKDERENYLVDPSLWGHLSGESTFGPRLLQTSMTRQGVLFLWPIRLPGIDGKVDSWNQSAMEAAALAQGKWIRLSANMQLGGYDVFQATGVLPDPEWPALTLGEILRLAFKDHRIDSIDHPVLRKLRGEI